MAPLKRLADAIDATNDWIGRAFAWLTLGMVLTEFVVVLSRYVFGLGSTLMQESIVYMHATVFLVCAGYALFYLRSVAPPEVTTMHIYRGVVPFAILQLMMLVILTYFPEMATWLPKVIFG